MRWRAKALWLLVAGAAALLWTNPKGLIFLLPVVVAFLVLPAGLVPVAGVTLVAVHIGVAWLIAHAERPEENRAFAPLTVLLVDLAILLSLAIGDWVLTRRHGQTVALSRARRLVDAQSAFRAPWDRWWPYRGAGAVLAGAVTALGSVRTGRYSLAILVPLLPIGLFYVAALGTRLGSAVGAALLVGSAGWLWWATARAEHSDEWAFVGLGSIVLSAVGILLVYVGDRWARTASARRRS